LDSGFFRSHILEDLIPFWMNAGLDTQHGGFFRPRDRAGRKLDRETKSSSRHGRMIYGFSVAYGLSKDAAYLDAAKQGVSFLVHNFWDHRYSGWYRQIRSSGPAIDTNKRAFDQAYVLSGLVEFFRITQDREVWSYIQASLDVLEEFFWDREFSGYYETLTREWQFESDQKTVCDQLDVMGSFLLLCRLDKSAEQMQNLRRIADLIVSRMLDEKYGCVLETFSRHWSYYPWRTRDRLLFGHNLKAVWQLAEAHSLTGESTYLQTARRLLDYCLQNAWDRDHGGFYQHGYRNGRLASDEKEWWSVSEGMSALLFMHRETQNPRYLEFFDKTARFALAHLFDPQYGEWFWACHADGRVKNDRKTDAYHSIQACLHAHELLRYRGDEAAAREEIL